MATIAELKVAIGADITEFNKKFADVTKSMEGMGKKMSKIGKSMSTYVTLPLVAAGAASIKMASDVDKGLREVNTLLSDSEKDFAGLGKGVEKLSLKIGVAQDKLTKGLYSAISAGVPKDNVFEFLEIASKAGIAGVTDTETAIDGITTTINAFGLEFGEAGAVADSMFAAVQGGKTTFEDLSKSMSNVAGAAAASKIPFQEVNAAIATLTSAGTPTSQAANQIRAAISAMQKPTTEMTKVFTDLGFASAQQAIAQNGLKFALNAVKESTGGSNGALLKLLGTEEAVAAANILAGTGAAKFATEMERQAKSAGVAQGAFDEMEKSNSRAMERMTVGLSNAGIAIGNILLPFVSKLADMISGLVNWFTGLDASTKKWIVGIAAVVAAIGPLLAMLGFFISTILPALIIGVKAVITVWSYLNGVMVANPIGAIVIGIAALVAGFVLLWNKVAAVRGVFKGLWEALKVIMKGFGDLGSIIAAAFSGDFKKIPNLVKSAMDNFGSKAGEAFTKAFVSETSAGIDELPSVIDKSIKPIIPDFEEKGKPIGDSIGKGIQEGVKDSFKELEKMLPKLAAMKIPEMSLMNMGAMGDSQDADMVFGDGFEDLDPDADPEGDDGKGKRLDFKKLLLNGLKAFGDGMKKMMSGLAGQFTSQMDNFGGAFDALMSGDVIGALLAVFGEFAEQSKPFTKLMESMNRVLKNVLTQFMPVFDKLVKAMNPLINIVSIIANALSQTLMFALDALIDPLLELLDLFTVLIPPIMGLVNAISGALGEITKLTVTALKPLIPIFVKVLDSITGIIQPFMMIISVISELLMPVLLSFSEMIGSVITTSLKIIAPILQLIALSLKPLAPIFEMLAFSMMPITVLFDLLGQAIEWLLGKIGLATGMTGENGGFSMPALAKGGIVNGPTTALIGEAGPEAVIPLSKLGGMMGGGDVTFRISGRDLVGVIQNTNNNGGRIG